MQETKHFQSLGQLSLVYNISVITDTNKVTSKVNFHKWLSQIILGVRGLQVHK